LIGKSERQTPPPARVIKRIRPVKKNGKIDWAVNCDLNVRDDKLLLEVRTA
jgi:hypothetical protein